MPDMHHHDPDILGHDRIEEDGVSMDVILNKILDVELGKTKHAD